ncbi:hypothetical protein DUNSADRAFT_1680 [Dunaliella salina]|uniref:Uncharacterized protein n=1 Tax=Dunaliella salina TaxID=3046 RepID=A0ABQ7GWS0_DUNSA|nr:hypothetical protein DUNSADRAFT_1680 [Dunaliella salina]|eukprot:KAF5839063.1 hypothetical protein DUNSADRAFT_1680 [Dunaliella salina]
MRASRHAQRAIKAVREAWLEDTIGKYVSIGQQGGGCAALIPNAHINLQSPASTSRQLSTSTATCSYDGFARVLRQPVPKSLVFNRKNLKVWLRSKWDLGIAGQLLQLQLQRGNPSDADAKKRALQLLAQASSLSDLSDFVEHLGPHVAPGLLASAAAQAANLLQASVVASATTTQPALDVKDAWPALGSVLHHLSPHLDKLAASEMSALLYGLSRTHYPLPSQTKTLLHQVEHRSRWREDACCCFARKFVIRSR